MEITTTYNKTFDGVAKERKHIILLDGTWNDETGIGADHLVTNIVNLHRILKNDQAHQIVRYHRGVGNDNDNAWVQTVRKGTTGKAIDTIIAKAYARFVQDWQLGDRIYIFGFSRGAAAARILASKIAKEGIPSEVKITLEAVQNQETMVVEQRIKGIVYKKNRSNFDTEIEFVGVWDTVSALGLGNNVLRFIGVKENDLFTDDHIAPNIQKAVHLVAIDETRNPFVPSLMNHKPGVTHEVWFPGVHSDIGGSYLEDDIAKASLFYMIKCMEQWNTERELKGFIFNEEEREWYTKEKIDKAHFHFHGKSFGKDLRPIGVQVNGELQPNKEPQIHQLYYDIVSARNSYSVFKVKKWLRKAVIRIVNFQYMPFNVKMLQGKFKIVS